MSILDRVIEGLAPGFALNRARARTALKVLARYEAAQAGDRALPGRRIATDADAAARQRAELAFIARDLVRNTPFAGRAQQVISNNVVGDGIIWKMRGGSKRATAQLREVLKAHLDTVAIDADGRLNLYGLQRLVMDTVVDAGEILIRRRRRLQSDGLPLPFQIQLLEADYLDTMRQGSTESGGMIRDGIEYDAIGRRVAYWLFDEHPGAYHRAGWRSVASRRVPASEILHIYRVDRPGQMRGVSWFAPVAMSLQDLGDTQDAHLMRQKIAACFAAFRVAPEADLAANAAAAEAPAGLATLIPGRIQNLMPGEDIRFSTPPGVDGYDEFTRLILRGVAARMGITYEALTGDLSTVNFSSARMGRMEMDRNVSSWQWLLLIPQMMQPLGEWIATAVDISYPGLRPRKAMLDWVPPHRMLVDPTREIPALVEKIRGGLASRSGTVRELGYDPEELLEEQKADHEAAEAAGLVFDSDARSKAGAAKASAPNAGRGAEPAPSDMSDDQTDDGEVTDGTQ